MMQIYKEWYVFFKASFQPGMEWDEETIKVTAQLYAEWAELEQQYPGDHLDHHLRRVFGGKLPDWFVDNDV